MIHLITTLRSRSKSNPRRTGRAFIASGLDGLEDRALLSTLSYQASVSSAAIPSGIHPNTTATDIHPIAQGQWSTIKTGHTLTVMSDGKVLDWEPATGKWRLWTYNAAHISDVLPTLYASGQWSSIKTGHTLTVMSDGKVLDWEPSTGKWRLWTYDPSHKSDVLPTLAAHGQWSSIKTGHTLIKMQDGKVLDWESATGKWRLWNYNASHTSDVLPTLAASGTWATVRSGHTLVPLQGNGVGYVLDWEPTTGKWRTWKYVPSHTSDVLPTLVAQGQWSVIKTGHVLIQMKDGLVIDWTPSTGKWRLFDPS